MTGFQSPNYTQVPNDLFETYMSEMGEAELKVVLAIVRQTIGYHRKQTKFSIAKLKKITGLSRNGVKAGTEAAEAHGFIERLNPGEQGSAEWGLIVTPSASDPLSENDQLPPQPVTPTPSASDPQLRLNKEKESNKQIIESANKTVDAILENERIVQEKLSNRETWPHRDKFPDPIRELLDVFVRCTGIHPAKKDILDWLSTGQDWLDLGINRTDIERAAQKSRGDEKGYGAFVVGRPGSLTNTANMYAGERRLKGNGKKKGFDLESTLQALENWNG